MKCRRRAPARSCERAGSTWSGAALRQLQRCRLASLPLVVAAVVLVSPEPVAAEVVAAEAQLVEAVVAVAERVLVVEA